MIFLLSDTATLADFFSSCNGCFFFFFKLMKDSPRLQPSSSKAEGKHPKTDRPGLSLWRTSFSLIGGDFLVGLHLDIRSDS